MIVAGRYCDSLTDSLRALTRTTTFSLRSLGTEGPSLLVSMVLRGRPGGLRAHEDESENDEQY